MAVEKYTKYSHNFFFISIQILDFDKKRKNHENEQIILSRELIKIFLFKPKI